MTPDDDPEDEARTKLIETLLDESLEGFERVVTPDELRVIRMCLHDELAVHQSGRAMIRSIMEDPVVGASGTVAKETPATSHPMKQSKKGGLGS